MTVVRAWRARIDEGRAAEYERFAREVSLPMFRRQEGFERALMLRSGAECLVLTVWWNHEAVERLATSPTYLAAVSQLSAKDLLQGTQTVEIYTLHLEALTE